MPLFAALIYAPDSAHAPDATPEDIKECDDHAGELLAADSMLVAYALTPREYAVSVRVEGSTPGPFVDTGQIVAGFYVIEATDLDEAVRIAATNPVARTPGSGVEVRPVHSGGVIRAPRE
ncbi:hypothetical protein EDF24_2931 [Curtobacterium sp. PhB130]|uniref:YciI family protein n=1 Tax=unclassified Curtobacterium TaxID=257496 RepID=UPI000F4C568B|nr:MULTISPECIES: YciI family protein [unclassified Curtobacterium]ROP66024.1 hypothetical protein EDF55_0470 [Curtobacterium sp. ZW137]ROS73924.1 hypothetical protein EDF24_2931 [Curtobacterium sp. PhB130]